MIKTEIRYSWIYNHVLNRGKFTKKEFEKLKKDCKNFERLYKEYISKIIKLIEKYSKNKKWQYSFIPIYIIKNKFPMQSFSLPLTLKFRDKVGMLIVLIHELVHNNLPHKEQIKRRHQENEKVINSITKKVCEEIKIDIKKSPIKDLK